MIRLDSFGTMTLAAVVLGAALYPACAAGGSSGPNASGDNAGASSVGGSAVGGNADGGGGEGGATGGAGGTTSAGGAAGTGGSPDCQQADGVVLAMDELFLGEYDLNKQVSSDAWKKFGFDIDGVSTVNDFTGHCLPNNGASPATAFADGDDGLDNAFGKSVLPVLLGVNATLSQQANDTLNTGQFTMLWFFEKLGMSANEDPLVTKLYGGASLVGGPSWDGNDCWPVRESDLTDPLDITSSKVVFDKAVLMNDAWSSNGITDIVIPINIMGFLAPLKIYQARMSMTLAASHKGAALGQIGGVMDTEEFVEVVRDVAGTIIPGLCSGPTFDNIAAQIRQASDIMKDGTQDPNSVCDGISVGLGFTLLEVVFGKATPAGPAPVDPCP